jgi:hypothetical protein
VKEMHLDRWILIQWTKPLIEKQNLNRLRVEHAPTFTLFVWLISHQTTVLFSKNKSAPAISHQPNEHALLKPSGGCPISCAGEHRRLRHGQERIKGSGGRRGGGGGQLGPREGRRRCAAAVERDEQEMLSSPGLVD